MRRESGQVTIFVSLIMLCVFALFCVLLESARMAGARAYLQTAASSSLDSVFSRYHREMWDSYRLLFAEYEDGEEMKADFAAYLNTYLENSGWYPMALENMNVTEWVRATDDDGAHLEKEILDYMKYGVWKIVYDSLTEQELWDSSTEAAAVSDIGDLYQGHADEVLALERSLEAISDNLTEQEDERSKALRCLERYDCSGFCRYAGNLISVMKKIPALVRDYSKKADALALSLSVSRSEYEARKNDLGSSAAALLEEEISQYESYAREDGGRRQEVEALTDLSSQQISLVEEIIKEAEKVQRKIDSWDDDDDGPDLHSLWSPVIRHFKQLTIASLSFRHGIADKEKEGWLKNVEALCKGQILGLILPPGTDASVNSADTSDFPSETESFLPGARKVSLTDHLLINEYCGNFFPCFTDVHGTSVNSSAADVSASAGSLLYEMEYLTAGKDNDTDNLISVTSRLFALREGLNLLFLLGDHTKRQEATALAMTVTGILGIAPLVNVTAFFIMTVWAAGESLMDLRGLLSGRKVPVFKSDKTWTLSIDDLLALGQSGKADTGGGEEGLDYLSWLKVLLFTDEMIQQEYRMMDMIQMNIRKRQDSFRFRCGLYQTQLECDLTGKHVFFSLGLVEYFTGNRDHSYPMKVIPERVY